MRDERQTVHCLLCSKVAGAAIQLVKLALKIAVIWPHRSVSTMKGEAPDPVEFNRLQNRCHGSPSPCLSGISVQIQRWAQPSGAFDIARFSSHRGIVRQKFVASPGRKCRRYKKRSLTRHRAHLSCQPICKALLPKKHPESSRNAPPRSPPSSSSSAPSPVVSWSSGHLPYLH